MFPLKHILLRTSLSNCVACGAGFTGADLQNLMNEAAILAARRELKEISKEEIADALERIVAGPEKKGAVMSEQKKKLVAYHEARLELVAVSMLKTLRITVAVSEVRRCRRSAVPCFV